MKQTCIGEHLLRITMKRYWRLLKDWVTILGKPKQWPHYRNSVDSAYAALTQSTLAALYGPWPTKKHTTQKHSGEPTLTTAKDRTKRGSINAKRIVKE